MGEESAEKGHNEAWVMLDGFVSVGATSFDVTWTTRAGTKEWFRRSVPFAELARTLPAMIDAAPARQRNVIVRPHGPGVTFLQLDDLKTEILPRLAPAVFLILQTSPGNFQAWLAMRSEEDKDFARRLRQGVGADATASGATRVAGSVNFKDKYVPHFPRLTVLHAAPGRLTNRQELEELGLVAEPEELPPLRISPALPRAGNRHWPSYARCLEGAPLNSEETGPDVSRADFVFCMTAITWGFGTDETADRVMEESAKAKANGRGYAELTARNAARAVERRREQPRRRTVEHGRR